LVNGPPGVGKSAVASRYAEDHPLTLHLEIDAIRMSLGGWEEHEESKLLARALAVAMAEEHLRGGNDVIVAQYLGRTEFIETLDRLAQRLGISFVEILLMDTQAAVVDRFRARRIALAATDRSHPEGDVDESTVSEAISTSFERLEEVRAARAHTHVVSAADGTETTYRALCQALSSTDPSVP
jgi:predicted kinase